jgi:hypothetical protein
MNLLGYWRAVSYLAWIPACYFFVRGVFAGWTLLDEVNQVAPILQPHYRRWGWDPVRAWKRHEILFPEKAAERRNIRRLYNLSLIFAACAIGLQAWIDFAE